LGVIPQVVDTVSFIDGGEVAKVLILAFTVKVPHGMMEQDLARPVITVSDFGTGKVEHEIYTYGEQVVVMPIGVEREARKPAWKLAEEEVKNTISKYAQGPVKVEMTSDDSAIVKVRGPEMRRVIGKGGSIVDRIEKTLGIHIDVRELEAESPKKVKGIRYEPERQEVGEVGEVGEVRPKGAESPVSEHPMLEKTRKHLIMKTPELAGEDVEVYVEEEYLFSATVSRHGDIKVRVNSDLAHAIEDAVESGELLEIRKL
ncbi:MAG: KH domain-containing protein, partial [Methanosarcinaceae archaeon]|nr:KH domain-containing protein [Methanosarcinaceae archaeon]